MILLSKKEYELNTEEKLKVEIMKTLAQAKGYSSEDQRLQLDFRDGSGFEKAAKILMAKFNITKKVKNSEPEKQKSEEKPKIKKGKKV
jgi:hypothetical protein